MAYRQSVILTKHSTMRRAMAVIVTIVMATQVDLIVKYVNLDFTDVKMKMHALTVNVITSAQKVFNVIRRGHANVDREWWEKNVTDARLIITI